MAVEDYSWLRYYEDLYRRQKKINNELAIRLGETTSKTDELNVALNRVVGSPFWRILAPVRKMYGKLSGSGDAASAGSVASDATFGGDDDPCMTSDILYHKRLEQYEDFYGQWIRKDEIENHYLQYAESGRSRVREALYSIAYIEDCVGDNNPVKNVSNAQWILFVSKKGKLATGYAERLSLAFEGHENAVIAYADEDYYYNCGGNRRVEPNFKPGWSPDTLDSFFYFGNIALIRVDLACKLSWMGAKNGYVNVYDMFLQASEYVGKHYDDSGVIHVEQVLFHNDVTDIAVEVAKKGGLSINNDGYELWRGVCDRLNDDLADGKLCIGATAEYSLVHGKSLGRRGIYGYQTPGQDMHTMHTIIDRPVDNLISVLILSKDHPQVLKTLLESFVERTDYPKECLEFIIVDNGSSEDNKNIYIEEIEQILNDYRHKYVYSPQEFNFSKLCNEAASYAKGNLYLFLNDDIEVVQKDWLSLMAGYANLPHIGAVGAKLLYAGTDKIQHIGVTSLAIGPSHKLVIYPDDRSYYYGKNIYECDVLGVTGACLLVAAEKFKMAGGFNEEFAVAYNDVDLCMKIAKLGFTNLQCNGALLYHYESMSRGLDEGNDEKWNRLLVEKQKLYLTHPEFFEWDPYYNKNLIGNHSNYLSNFDFGYNIHLKHEIVRQLDASLLAKNESEKYKISIDFAGIQAKHNLEEPEITEVRGWGFENGGDNSLLIAEIVLQNITDGSLYGVISDPMPRDDLEKTFPNEKNNRLCGFTAKFLRNDVPEGEYVVGVRFGRLKHDLIEREFENEVVYTETRLTI